MIEVLRKIWRFAGEEQGNIRKSMVLGFFYAIFHMFQIGAIYVVVLALVDGSTSAAPAWEALALLLVSILGRAIMNRFSQLQQTHAGYFMAANKRLSMGDKLKRIPMGYFNDQSLGELTGIATTVLDEVESAGAMVLVTILGGLINSAVMLLCVLFWDWRIGLLALAISFTAALTTSLATEQAVVEAAHLSVAINQVDSLVLAAILGAMALLGAVAVVGMSSRSRQRELAVLRCAGSTVRGVLRQVVVEAALYVGTALLISLVPLVVTTAGESLFYARAGLPLVVRPGVGPVLLVALLSFLALTAVLLAPIRGAARIPIGAVLAAE